MASITDQQHAISHSAPGQAESPAIAPDEAGVASLDKVRLDDQLAHVQREIRQQILEVEQRLTDEIRGKLDAVLARLNREADDLRHDKADRMTLAALFTEMAVRLTHEPVSRSEQE